VDFLQPVRMEIGGVPSKQPSWPFAHPGGALFAWPGANPQHFAGRILLNALVGPGHMIELDGAIGYNFTFCGCKWHYMMTLGDIPQLAECCLQQDGTLPIIKKQLAAFRHYQALRDSEKEC
jgi:hypothetical protein